jgi:hypothetical protein
MPPNLRLLKFSVKVVRHIGKKRLWKKSGRKVRKESLGRKVRKKGRDPPTPSLSISRDCSGLAGVESSKWVIDAIALKT